MRIYIAGKFERRPILRPYAAQIWELGHEITSSWLNEVSRMPQMQLGEFMRKLAVKDLTEIRAADLLILDTGVASERGGKEVEFGFALGQHQGKLLWIVGPPRNVFHWLADRVFESWEHCLTTLEEEYTDAVYQTRGQRAIGSGDPSDGGSGC